MGPGKEKQIKQAHSRCGLTNPALQQQGELYLPVQRFGPLFLL